MEIKSTITNHAGKIFDVAYKDIEDVSELGTRKVGGVHGVCFSNDKLVIVYNERKQRWDLPGGGVEKEESFEEALVREVKEETNMRVIKQKLIGVQDIFTPEGIRVQTRSVCIVEPYGPFLGDPDDGEITEIKLIDPDDYKKYVDWGEVGDWIMTRAKELLSEITLK